MARAKGFIVAAWEAEGRVLATGRLEEGRSFALVLGAGRSALFVSRSRAESAAALLGPLGASLDPEAWSDMAGAPLARLLIPSRARGKAERLLGAAGIPIVHFERGGAEEYLAARGIASGVEIEGEERQGRQVDTVFIEPSLSSAWVLPPLRWLALDIETDPEGGVTAVSLAETLFPPAENAGSGGERDFKGEVLFLGPPQDLPWISSYWDETSLLAALCRRLVERDPDVITGWNLLDFDLTILERRCVERGIPFLIGRSRDVASFVELKGRRRVFDLPGRAAIDAMRLFRASGERFEDQSLETVSRNLLGEGKSVSSRGEEKLAELGRLREEDPVSFCSYCLRDSELVLRILDKTGLAALTAKRAALTGLSLDLAWTSIPAFERVYGAVLRERCIVPPDRENRRVSGAAGGTVLDPRAGLFEGVLVFDFRSLYPSLMRTFNIDPLAYARAAARPPEAADIVAPNGARFNREPGVLPAVIARYAAEREAALAAGDDTAAYVYKILQNSFYGVLGAEGCRYARTELAGAITSFARKYLVAARDFFEAKGYRALYGDTDSVFVESGLGAGTPYAELAGLGESLAAELNPLLAASIREEFGLESFLKIRCEKVYARFFIPRLRLDPGFGARMAILRRGETEEEESEEGEGQPRGRAKGYAGLRLEEGGTAKVEVKGMEAARSDGTALARRFQVELLGLAFGAASAGLRPAGEAEIAAYCRETVAALRRGAFDEELLYRKYLRRPAADYASETPQVRAARLLGWEGRRGRVSYYMTTAGAEPPERRSGASLDYEHYVEKQLLPIAKALADEAGWDAGPWFADRPQMELEF